MQSDCSNTTEELTRQFIRERWVGEIQTFLEQMIDAAPDDACRNLGRFLWNTAAEHELDD